MINPNVREPQGVWVWPGKHASMILPQSRVVPVYHDEVPQRLLPSYKDPFILVLNCSSRCWVQHQNKFNLFTDMHAATLTLV